jgi:hypothetical protein
VALAEWCRRFILFHGKHHPRDLGLVEIGVFLKSIPQTENDALRALAASREALDFLYREVLQLDLGELPLPRPPRPWPPASCSTTLESASAGRESGRQGVDRGVGRVGG